MTVPVPTYSAMHQRIRRHLGSAKAHRCIDCGQPAHEWSYNKTDPQVLTEWQPNKRYPFEYSLDVSNYDPRCRSCHMRFDRPGGKQRPRTHCKHGHEFTPENTRLTPNGRRACRTCSAKAAKRANAKKKAERNFQPGVRCRRGHPMTVGSTGKAGCKTCATESLKRRRAIQKAERNYQPPTHCIRGHEFSPENTYRTPTGFSPENTYRTPTGSRRCKACHRMREANRKRGR